MNLGLEPRLVRRWLMERVERTSARSVAEELALDMPALIAELYSHGELRPAVLEATTRWLRDNDICLSGFGEESVGSIEQSRSRLMVALDLQSLDVPPRCMRLLDEAVMEVVEERLGNAWVREIYRLYPKALEKRETVERVRRLKAQRKVRRWRFPRHRGRKPPRDWDRRILEDALEWCIRDPSAVPDESVMVLVSNGGRFDGLVDELEGAGVELLLVTVGGSAPALEKTFGADRTLRVRWQENDISAGESDGRDEGVHENARHFGRAVDSRGEKSGVGAERSD